MAKRGRKPKEKQQYFCVNEEDAIVQYLKSTNEAEKNKIFNDILYPALTKMIESIIRRYKLFVPDEDFEQNFSDTISYLLTKIQNYSPERFEYDEISDMSDYNSEYFVEMQYDDLKKKIKSAQEEDPDFVKVYIPSANKRASNDIYTYDKKYYKKELHKYKAYSYCGTICKNYLMGKCSQYTKHKQRNMQYDDISDEINNNIKYIEPAKRNTDIDVNLINKIAGIIEEMTNKKDENQLTNEEVVVGNALVHLLRNWEEVLPYNGSNKLQKNSVLYFLREETMMTTKEVRTYMKKYKSAYYILKDIMLQDGSFENEHMKNKDNYLFENEM